MISSRELMSLKTTRKLSRKLQKLLFLSKEKVWGLTVTNPPGQRTGAVSLVRDTRPEG